MRADGQIHGCTDGLITILCTLTGLSNDSKIIDSLSSVGNKVDVSQARVQLANFIMTKNSFTHFQNIQMIPKLKKGVLFFSVV